MTGPNPSLSPLSDPSFNGSRLGRVLAGALLAIVLGFVAWSVRGVLREPETAVPAAPVTPAQVVSTALYYGALIDDENFQVLLGLAYGKAGRDRTRRLELLESSADRSAPSRNGKGERSPRHLNLSPTREAQPTR